MILNFNFEFACSLNNDASACTGVGSWECTERGYLQGGRSYYSPRAMLDAMYVYA